MPASVLKVNYLSREAAETGTNIAKSLNCTDNLILELDECQTSKPLTSNMVRNAEACVQAQDRHVAASNLEYSNIDEKLAQVEKDLRTRVTAMEA